MKTLHSTALTSTTFVLTIGLALAGRPAIAQAESPQKADTTSHASRLSFNPDSTPFDRSFREWSAEWWQYVFSVPASVNPLTDRTGDYCAVGQHGPVWFLTGSLDSSPVARTCLVPEDKALFLPVINHLNNDSKPISVLRAEIAPCIDAVTSLEVDVDGRYVEELWRSRYKSVPFDFTTPPDALLGVPPEVNSPSVDDGYYVMLKPLSVGNHRVHISATQKKTKACGPAFTIDVAYDLSVAPVDLENARR